MNSLPRQYGLTRDDISTYGEAFALRRRFQAAVVRDAAEESSIDHVYLNIMGCAALGYQLGYRLERA